MSAALGQSRRYSRVQLVAADSDWSVADAMATDPSFNKAVSVVGVHYPCGWLSDTETCPASPDALKAQALGKPLWASEDGSQQYDNGSFALARMLNRQYIQEKVTAAINWSLISSWYSTLPFSGAGLMLADQPWSGSYTAGTSLWTVAQTTQFAQPGWRYIDSADGMLTSGGSYVTLRSPHTGDYSTVVETTDATASQTAHFTVGGGLSTGAVHVWATDLRSDNPALQFQHVADIQPRDGSFSATLAPGYVYTFSTTTGQHKGTATASARAAQSLPFTQDFERTAPGTSPADFSDLNGAFQAEPCIGRKGTCLQQVVTQQPVAWFDGDSFPWGTVFGLSARSWRSTGTSHRASADFQKNSYWRHRGKLDVPKERFISYPDASPDSDAKSLLIWLIGERSSTDGWETARAGPTPTMATSPPNGSPAPSPKTTSATGTHLGQAAVVVGDSEFDIELLGLTTRTFRDAMGYSQTSSLKLRRPGLWNERELRESRSST